MLQYECNVDYEAAWSSRQLVPAAAASTASNRYAATVCPEEL